MGYMFNRSWSYWKERERGCVQPRHWELEHRNDIEGFMFEGKEDYYEIYV